MRKYLYLLCLFSISILQAQAPKKLNSAEIYKEIQKLNFLGSALYVAAHPDDENTRLISYLSNELNARTAYLSLTRGDGGQNLIGPELRELLGLIRTQELLAARDIDGGQQFFTRANDFGYSKNPEETLSIWKEEEILKDVVRNIRKFKPDVIINRFNAASAGETHGHHTSSAILSTRAFKLSAEKSAFSTSEDFPKPWEPKKLFFNTSPWFYDSQEAFEAADKSNFLEFDTGVYYPLSGLSNTEIASLSRSQHQSQGFGSTGTRGTAMEYVALIEGEHPKGSDSLFAGINTTWSRVKGGKEVGKILYKVEKEYNFKDPSASVPALLKAYELILKLEDEHWKEIKLEQIKNIIAASAGLFLEATASEAMATAGEMVDLKLEAINRSPLQAQLLSFQIQPTGKQVMHQKPLINNESWKEETSLDIPATAGTTSPYWLEEKGSLGMYDVSNPQFIGLPETPRPYQVTFNLEIEGVKIPFSKEIVYKTNDPVKGETYRPFEIVPPVSITTGSEVNIFPNEKEKSISVVVKAYKNNVKGSLSPGATGNWSVAPNAYDFGPLKKGEEVSFVFTITPPKGQEQLIFNPVVTFDGRTYSRAVVEMDYEHIPLQTLVLPNDTKLVKLNIQKKGELIGYLEGAGDVVPKALEQMGYQVEYLTPEEITTANLKKYDAVVLGIRAYNTVEALAHKQQVLFEYVASGGNMLVQYNTNRGLVTNELAPYPLELSRDRVTDEAAEVRFLAKDHPVLNFPNKITKTDFDGWVQERGLYFPNKWAPEFVPILTMNDKGESPKEGSLLVAEYGKGHFIYTGLSFFREVPAGVPGAFRLLANIISLGKGQETAAPSKRADQ